MFTLNRLYLRAYGVLLLSTLPCLGWAAGTPAGTLISNVVTLNYSLAGAPQAMLTSTAAQFLVDEIIHPTLTCQSVPTVAVSSPSVNDVLTFVLTNSGNGTESFSLARTNGGATLLPARYLPKNSAQYDPLNSPTGAIFLETNNVVGFQAGADVAYLPGTNDPLLVAGTSKTIYVLSDTPAVSNGALGDVLLTATSLTPGAAGSPYATKLLNVGDNLGKGASSALVATPLAQAAATGTYSASGVGLLMNKTVLSRVDPTGGTLLMPGTMLTYQITVGLSGVGTATGLVITDPLPADLSYVPASISVGGVAQTDAADADQAQFIAATPTSTGTISVSLGNVVAPANLVITFRATIN